jgi:hypothetical protein
MEKHKTTEIILIFCSVYTKHGYCRMIIETMIENQLIFRLLLRCLLGRFL